MNKLGGTRSLDVMIQFVMVFLFLHETITKEERKLVI